MCSSFVVLAEFHRVDRQTNMWLFLERKHLKLHFVVPFSFCQAPLASPVRTVAWIWLIRCLCLVKKGEVRSECQINGWFCEKGTVLYSAVVCGGKGKH